MIIPLIMLAVLVYGLIKKVPVFALFTDGAKEGLHTMYAIAPPLIGLITAIGMLKASGAMDMLTSLLTPAAEFMHIPPEVTSLFLLKPISGSGSLAVLSRIISDNGADSLAAKTAAVMTGSTETTFYCIAVYYGSVNISKTGCTVPCAIIGDFVGMATAIILTSLAG